MVGRAVWLYVCGVRGTRSLSLSRPRVPATAMICREDLLKTNAKTKGETAGTTNRSLGARVEGAGTGERRWNECAISLPSSSRHSMHAANQTRCTSLLCLRCWRCLCRGARAHTHTGLSKHQVQGQRCSCRHIVLRRRREEERESGGRRDWRRR